MLNVGALSFPAVAEQNSKPHTFSELLSQAEFFEFLANSIEGENGTFTSPLEAEELQVNANPSGAVKATTLDEQAAQRTNSNPPLEDQ
jgi:hypothetical protein